MAELLPGMLLEYVKHVHIKDIWQGPSAMVHGTVQWNGLKVAC